jgi:uncharacterized protein (TIGR00251 family)
MIQVNEHAEGCILPVRAQPGAKKASVVGDYNGALKIAVTSPPENGRANDAVVEALRDSLGLKRSQISLIIGQTSRDKKFLIRGMSKPELESLLLALVPGQ